MLTALSAQASITKTLQRFSGGRCRNAHRHSSAYEKRSKRGAHAQHKDKIGREKNRRAVSEDLEAETNSAPAEEAEETAAENVSASKDPVEEPEERQDDDVDSLMGDLTNFTKGLVSSAKKHRETLRRKNPLPRRRKKRARTTSRRKRLPECSEELTWSRSTKMR